MTYVFAGLVLGAVFAILGTSITLTFSSTGILNLGAGAMAYAVADLFYYLTFELGWTEWVAAVLCVAGFGPVMGFVLWGVVFRRLEKSDLIVQFVATIGLSVALPAIMLTAISHDVVGQVPGIIHNGQRPFKLLGLGVTPDQCAAIVGAVLAVGGVIVLLNRTSFGLSTRAVVDRPALAQSRGINPKRISALAWILASTLVSLGAVLIAPLVALDPSQYTSLTIAALGAALLGRFHSLSWTVFGGFALGVVESLVTGLAPTNNVWLTTLGPAVPFFLLLVLLLLGRTPFSSRRDVATGTSTSHLPIAPRRPRPAADRRLLDRGLFTASGGLVLAVGGALALMFAFNSYWTGLIAVGTAFSVLFLSFSVAAGEAGILCLGQAAVAGVGAFGAGRLATDHHWPLGLAIVGGVLVATAVGFVLGLIGARLDQIGFALMTLAFAVFCDQWAFNQPSLVPSGGVQFASVSFFGLSLERTSIALNLVVFAVLAVCFVAVRRGRLGRIYAGLRGNPVSGQSLGLNVRALRTAAFAVSSGIAGLGGILLSLIQQGMSPIDVVTAVGLVWIAVVVTLGVRGVRGALLAGLLFGVMPGVFAQINVSNIGNVPSILFGLGAIGLAQEPRGFLAQVDRGLANLRARARPTMNSLERGSVSAAVPSLASAEPSLANAEKVGK